MSEPAALAPQPAAPRRAATFLAALPRYAVVTAMLIVFAVFSLATPSFLTPANLASILVNNFALLAIVALAMTLAVSAGGIDLSVGTAVDFAGLTFVSLVLGGQPVPLAAVAAVACGGLVGAFNAVLIAGLGITPFLATLGTLFIGRSGQQLLTNGGNPVYLPQAGIPPAFAFLGHGAVFGVPTPLVAVAAAAALLAAVALTRFGRAVLAIGVQSGVARYSGLRVARTLAGVYIGAALIAAVAGVLLTATVSVYVPNSGSAFLLNAIGATFIGTTLSGRGRPNVAGTLVGVLLLAVVSNGLLITGISFYWQQVATGLLILAVLALSFLNRNARRA